MRATSIALKQRTTAVNRTVSFHQLRPSNNYLHKYTPQLDHALNKMEQSCLQGDAVQIYMPRKHAWRSRFSTMSTKHQFTVALVDIDNDNDGQSDEVDIAGVSAFAVQNVHVSTTANRSKKSKIEFPFIGDLRVNPKYRGMGMASQITAQQLHSIQNEQEKDYPFWMCSVKVDNPASLKLYRSTFGAKALCKWYAHWASTQLETAKYSAAMESDSDSLRWTSCDEFGRVVVIEAHIESYDKQCILSKFFSDSQLFPINDTLQHLVEGDKVVTYTARYESYEDGDDDAVVATLSTYKSPVCQMGFVKAPLRQKCDLLVNCIQQRQFNKMPSVLSWLLVDALPQNLRQRIDFRGVIEDTVYMFAHGVSGSDEEAQNRLYQMLYEHAAAQIKQQYGLTSFACINNPKQENLFGELQQKGMSITEYLLCADNGDRFVDHMIEKENEHVFLNPKLF